MDVKKILLGKKEVKAELDLDKDVVTLMTEILLAKLLREGINLDSAVGIATGFKPDFEKIDQFLDIVLGEAKGTGRKKKKVEFDYKLSRKTKADIKVGDTLLILKRKNVTKNDSKIIKKLKDEGYKVIVLEV